MRHFAHLLAGLAGCLLAAVALAGEPCRIAFDMGSSGIRAGESGRTEVMRADIDYLAPLSAGRGLAETLPPTIAALRNLPAQGSFDQDCPRLGGGFSAWRIAAKEDRQKLADDLAAIRADSGVAVLVIPQRQEGAYGYQGARQLLGDKLTTSHILDIGGGSLQVAGERDSFGALFGQKLWHRELCKALRNSSELPCALQPMTPQELDSARSLLRDRLHGIVRDLPQGATLTAISRPVTRGVAPAVARLFNRPAGLTEISPAMLRATLELHAGLSLDAMAERLGSERKHAAYLISDLLLVEGLMEATGGHDLRIAEIDLTNLPGLLADDRGYRWAARHDCYLQRLRSLGVAAYFSDPATCAARPAAH
ncbi:hypothetical protein LZ012_16105 [Dechloromonas sp. XY25]|uniref:Ppx/GppA phosphatase N-terminal domain-containing protein n=1 Tax=Dechloromonas hankyongensis TaxID=2908002 RepID=A0ABS9K5R9_9RHOO|nr:hypothetical protein [Dechloromonas hankyongensis]MCG2578520.1 hypothetical protein [Dechloromonas hankyongensis]